MARRPDLPLMVNNTLAMLGRHKGTPTTSHSTPQSGHRSAEMQFQGKEIPWSLARQKYLFMMPQTHNCSARLAQAHTTTHVLSLLFDCLLTLHTASRLSWWDRASNPEASCPLLPIKQELDVLIVQILYISTSIRVKKSFAMDLYAFLPFIARPRPSPPVCSSRKDHLYDMMRRTTYSRTTPGTWTPTLPMQPTLQFHTCSTNQGMCIFHQEEVQSTSIPWRLRKLVPRLIQTLTRAWFLAKNLHKHNSISASNKLYL